MQRDLVFLVVLFLIIATYLYIAASVTANSESSIARFGLSVGQSYGLSTSLYIMSVILFITAWFGFPMFFIMI